MTEREKEPEFDSATWTPDKPWPKGYYKPVLGITAAMERINRATGRDDAGIRNYFWGLLAFLSQLVGLFAAGATPRMFLGLMFQAINRAVTIWPLLIFLTLLLPALLFAGIVAGENVPFRRRFAFGLFWAVASLATILLIAQARPLVTRLFDFLVAAMAPP